MHEPIEDTVRDRCKITCDCMLYKYGACKHWCARNTILCVVQVFFPSETPDQSLPRWFFDRSPSEVKAAFLAKRNNDELDKVGLVLSDFLFI